MEYEHQVESDRRSRVWVQGRLDEGFSQGLSGIDQEDVPAGTMLSGPMVDQSQLHSTLDLLRNLGVDVLRFEVDPPHVSGFGAEDEPDAARGEGSRPRRPHESTDRPSQRSTGHDQGKAR